jgi:hypothetical protein
MGARVGRRLAALSVVVALVAPVLVVGGVALADTTASLVQAVFTGTGSGWSPPSNEPSGAAYIDDGGYLLVVDTNYNVPTENGWEVDVTAPSSPVNRGTGVSEPTGVTYDPASNTLFISSDATATIEIVRDFDGNESHAQINAAAVNSFDTEDPAFNQHNGHLYWVDGNNGMGPRTLYDVDPGGNGQIDGSDSIASYDIDTDIGLSIIDLEGLTWDPQTGCLLLGNTLGGEVYKLDASGSGAPSYVDTITLPGFGPSSNWISGMGMAPDSNGSGSWNLWVTDRNSNGIHELAIDHSVTCSTGPTTTTTTQPTTTTTAPTTTTTQPTTTTTQPTTTTTQPTTTTTQPTTTTTQPTTTTTQPTTTTTQPTTTTTQPTTTTTQPTTTTTQPTTTTTQPTTTTTQPTTTTTTPTTTTTTTPPPTNPEPPNPFIDSQKHLFGKPIGWLAQTGITKGCNPPANTLFCPDDYVTRGQMAAFLVRARGYSSLAFADYFIDDDGSVFENDINQLKEMGVTQGCNPPVNNEFCPDSLVTRGQMAAFLVRFFGYTDNGGGNLFIDDDGSIFENDIDKLGTAGVTKGCNPPTNNEFCPDDYVTRGQMAAFLQRAFEG